MGTVLGTSRNLPWGGGFLRNLSALRGGVQGAGGEAAAVRWVVRQQFRGKSCEEKLFRNWHSGIAVQFGLPLLW